MVERLYEKLSNLLGAPYCFRVHLFLMVIASEFTLSVYINFGRLKKLKLLSQIEIAPNFYFFVAQNAHWAFFSAGSVALVSTCTPQIHICGQEFAIVWCKMTCCIGFSERSMSKREVSCSIFSANLFKYDKFILIFFNEGHKFWQKLLTLVPKT